MTVLDIFQISYEIPLYICYTIFTIQLGYKLIKKEKAFSNPFYILVFYKGVTDITLQTTIFLLAKITVISSFHDFFQKNSHLCSVFYLLTTPCYSITFEVMLIMSLNRYIAVREPLMYSKLFKNYLVYIYIFTTIVIGGLIGVISSHFDCTYMFSSDIERLYITYTTEDIISFVLAYIFGLYIPLIIISLILNIITIRKLKVKNLISSMGSSPDMRLLIYTLFSFGMAIVFLSSYILRVVSIFTGNKIYNIIGTISLSYIVDIETYGSFLCLLITK
uniref:G_PROTEIN_RECEP_F1_2 domain-containing protein n=1 Tax=Strongyloides papillosus TaxID=174720 RepID=A0A0N5C107_STREA